MAFIDPKDQKSFERDPEEGNFPGGLYLCELSRVEEIGPSAKFPNGNPRLVFEFTLCDPDHPQYRGKKCATFVGRTLLKSKEGRESNLVKMARMMGVKNPEAGFDPEHLVGKKYRVMTEHTDGRSWARSVIAAPDAGTNTAYTPAAPQSPPPAAQPAAQPAADPYQAGRTALLSAGNEAELRAAWEAIDAPTQQQLHGVLLGQKAAHAQAATARPAQQADRIPF